MESITIKVNDEMSKQIKNAMKPNYTTKTEFIRSAVRNKIKDIENDRVLKSFKEFQGSAKVCISDKKFEKNRELAFKELLKKKGWKLD